MCMFTLGLWNWLSRHAIRSKEIFLMVPCDGEDELVVFPHACFGAESSAWMAYTWAHQTANRIC